MEFGGVAWREASRSASDIGVAWSSVERAGASLNLWVQGSSPWGRTDTMVYSWSEPLNVLDGNG
jgi:hypothetical protein